MAPFTDSGTISPTDRPVAEGDPPAGGPLAVGIWILGSQFTADYVLIVESRAEYDGKTHISSSANRN